MLFDEYENRDYWSMVIFCEACYQHEMGSKKVADSVGKD